MEMCYQGTLAMPKSYAVMDQDEMMYVEGGYYIDWSVESATKWFNGIAAIAGVWLGGTATVSALIRKVGKNKAIKVWTELAIYFGVKKTTAKKVGKVISAFTGISIGGGLAKALDYIDKTGTNGSIQF